MTSRKKRELLSSCERVRSWSEYVQALQKAPQPFDQQWAHFQAVFAGSEPAEGPPPVWQPTLLQQRRSNLGQLIHELGLTSYAELFRWSIAQRGAFWEKVIERLQITFVEPPRTILDSSAGALHPRWLVGASFNIVDSCFGASAEKTAVIWRRTASSALERISYGALERLVNRLANGLGTLGLIEEDGIALYLPMNLECVVAYLAIVRAGYQVVSIADSFSAAEVERRVEIAGARALITTERYQRGGKSIELYDKIRAARLPRIVVIPAESGGACALRPGDLWWSQLLSDSDTFASRAGSPDRVSNILFSSGTTSTPKAIPWTHLTPLKCAMDGHFHQDIHSEDIVAWPTNIGWMMGPWLIYATLMNRATMALYEGVPTEAGFVRFVQDARVSILGLVPSLVRAWRQGEVNEGVDWSQVRLFSSTGEPSSQEDYLWLMSLAGYQAPVIEYCGGTEIGGGYLTGTVVQAASPATFSSPALGIDLAILDEQGHPVASGGQGEGFLVPPSIGLSARLLNKDHDEIYYQGCPGGPRGQLLRRHGDQMTLLSKGYFKAQGRADDTMNLGGIKISSLELEQILDQHPAISQCAAIGVQSGGEGMEQLVVFAVLRAPLDPSLLRVELNALLAQRLNPLFKIAGLEFVEELPRTATNKLLRRELRRRWGHT
jgi:acetyl-CoA synthetase